LIQMSAKHREEAQCSFTRSIVKQVTSSY
jgi:hypothetical protein